MELIQPRHILQREFAERCERNPRYSLRAFARSLGLSHSTLSMVISGKRRLSRKMFAKVAGSLRLTADETSAVARLTGTDDLSFIEGPDEIQYQQISVDTFAAISDWYHYAILCLMNLKDAQFTPDWISERLGITHEIASDAIDRLTRLRMMIKVGRRWKPAGLPLNINNSIQISTEATRKFHTQILLKAIESLNHDPADRRLFNGTTVNLDPAVLPQALARIRSFQRRMVREFEDKGSPSRAYALTIQYFPLDKEPKRHP